MEQLAGLVIQETLELLDQLVSLDFLEASQPMEQLELQVPLDKRARLVALFLSLVELEEMVAQQESKVTTERLEIQDRQV